MSEQMTLEQAKAQVERLQDELQAAKEQVRALRPVKAKAEPKLCACDECGLWTNGGDFLPGHDSKLRSRLLKAIDAGDESAIDQLLARPKLAHGATESELRTRLGSETRKKEAQVEREAEAQAKRDAAKSAKKVTPAPKPSAKTRVDPIEAQQGTRSPSVTRNGAAIKLAKERAA